MNQPTWEDLFEARELAAVSYARGRESVLEELRTAINAQPAYQLAKPDLLNIIDRLDHLAGQS